MITEFHFIINWAWVIWPVIGIVAVALVGGMGTLIGYSWGHGKGYDKGQKTVSNLPPRVH